MFGKKKGNAPQSRIDSLIGVGTRIEGNVVFKGGLRVDGEVQGNIFATERLEITASGRVIGDITAPRVSIAEGVVFEGKCTMKPPSNPVPQQK